MVQHRILASFALFLLFATAGCSRGSSGSEPLDDAMAAARDQDWERGATLAGRHLATHDDAAPEAHMVRGLCLYMSGKQDAAMNSFEAAAVAAPKNFLAQYFYGWALCESEQYESALPVLERAHRLRPEHVDLLVLLSRACLANNLVRGTKYLGQLQEYPAFSDGPEIDNALASLSLARHDYDQAREYFLQALAKDPDNEVVLQNLAVLHDQFLHDVSRAVFYYKRCLGAAQRHGNNERQARTRARLLQLARERRNTSS